MSIKSPQTVSELIDALCAWLSNDVWPGLPGYADALPEPDTGRAVERSPFFCVVASSGTCGVNRGNPAQSSARVSVSIYLQVRSAQADGTDYFWAVRTLRNRIDALARALYTPSNGIVCGALPGAMSWEIPESQPRPVWQAVARVEFELKSQARYNGGFLC